MKTYNTGSDGCLLTEDTNIPKGHRLYEIALREVKAGEAKIIAYIESSPNKVDLNTPYLAYLSETDWYVVRFIETGVAIPKDIKDLRSKARESI